jgi:hypothetical protein
VRPEGLGKLKKKIGIEPATFRFVANALTTKAILMKSENQEISHVMHNQSL